MTDYTQSVYVNSSTDGMIVIPDSLTGFFNSYTETVETESNHKAYCIHGRVPISPEERICAVCGGQMHVNNTREASIWHIPIGGAYSCLKFDKHQLRCSVCGKTRMQNIPFKAEGHLISCGLYQFTMDLLAIGTHTLKQVAELTGLNKNTVKTIDEKRLRDKYTIDGTKLIQPEHQTRFIGIDEFKLHNGHRYATHIVDMETGHILWISYGKKKQVVYDFIDHVGIHWMEGVEAVACDMNSDFQEAFEDRCEWIQPVFDHFHIVKNFNDKVVSQVRRDEQLRLQKEGRTKEAESLKKTKYILTSSRSTLRRKDEEARNGKVISRGNVLFHKENVTRMEGYEARYNELLLQNNLLFTVDVVKEKLDEAYRSSSEAEMAEQVIDIIDVCKGTGNAHFKWFGRLLENHFEGIIAHGSLRISSGKIEGINNKIKTLRRQGYGYPDDEYFFLRLMDMSRESYVRNPKSHKFRD